MRVFSYFHQKRFLFIDIFFLTLIHLQLLNIFYNFDKPFQIQAQSPIVFLEQILN